MSFRFKLWQRVKRFFRWLWAQLKDWRNLVLFCVVSAVFHTPFWLGWLLFWLTGNAWHLTYANGWALFWTMPFTPAIPLQIAITLGIRGALEKLRKRRNKKDDSESRKSGY